MITPAEMDARARQIVSLRDQGLTRAMIARMLNLSNATVSKDITRLSRSVWTPETQALALKMRKAKKSTAEIAAAVGLAQSTVAQKLRQHGMGKGPTKHERVSKPGLDVDDPICRRRKCSGC